MERTQLERIGWVCGILAAVLIFVGFFAIDESGSTPPDGSMGALVQELTDSPGGILAGSLVGIFGGALVLPFVASFRMRVSRVHMAGELLGHVAFGSGVVMMAGALLHGSFRMAETTVRDPVMLADAMRPLAMLKGHIDGPLVWGAVTLVLAISVSAFLDSLVPRTLAVFGVALVAATVALTPTDHGGVGVALFLWIAVASAFLLRLDSSAARANTVDD